MRKAIVPGSFDPVTFGHLDIIRRAAKLFDCIVVTVTVNAEKKPLFTVAQRLAFLKESLDGISNIEFDVCDGLLATYAKSKDACALVKGVRYGGDFDYEHAMATANFQQTRIETVLLPATPDVSYISSTVAKQVARFSGNVTLLVPPCVEKALCEKSQKGEI